MVGYLGDNSWWKLVGITNEDYGRTSVTHGNQRLSFFSLTSLQMCKDKQRGYEMYWLGVLAGL